MSKQLFNAYGVTAKISELQALPDEDLRIQADSIRDDFQPWMFYNFDLDDEQATYLQQMNSTFVRELSGDIADCMLFRLPLYVTFGARRPTGSKFVQPTSELIRVYDPVKGYVVTGQLRILIGYR